MLSDDADDSKIIEDVHVPSKTASIIEDVAVGSNTSIIDEILYLLIVSVMMLMK